MIKIEITLAESDSLAATPTVIVSQTAAEECALEKAILDGIKEGKSQFATELKEYIYRNYGDAKGAIRATSSHIMDMIDAMLYGYCGFGPPPTEAEFATGRLAKWEDLDG